MKDEVKCGFNLSNPSKQRHTRVQETKVHVALAAILTPSGLGPVLLALTGMELGPFREDAGVWPPLVTMALLGEEVGLVAD